MGQTIGQPGLAQLHEPPGGRADSTFGREQLGIGQHLDFPDNRIALLDAQPVHWSSAARASAKPPGR